jgi:hypothetical protein
MGGFEVASDPVNGPRRLFGRVAANLEFTDEDGVSVLVALNVDADGHLFGGQCLEDGFPTIDPDPA